MFIRYANSQITRVYNNFAECREDWKGFSRSASSFKDKEFEFSDDFLYYRARAITSDVPNSNGDYFPLSELHASYDTFVGKGIYLNHNTDNPENSFGIILDAEMIDTPMAPRLHGTGYIELLGAVDKELASSRYPEMNLVHRIQSGLINATSMSCFCTESECGICHHVAYSPDTLCAHMHPDSVQFIKGKRAAAYGADDIAYEISRNITFTEDSVLTDAPADHTARIMSVITASKKQGSGEMERLKKLLSHFKLYREKTGKEVEAHMDVSKIPVIRKAAEDGKLPPPLAKGAPKSDAKAPAKPDDKGGKPAEGVDVTEKVDDLDKYVQKMISQEVDAAIKRVVSEAVRKELGKQLTQLEQGIRPEVQQVVLDEARNVERDIKHVAPGGAAPAKEEPASLPAEPRSSKSKSKWIRKARRTYV